MYTHVYTVRTMSHMHIIIQVFDINNQQEQTKISLMCTTEVNFVKILCIQALMKYHKCTKHMITNYKPE